MMIAFNVPTRCAICGTISRQSVGMRSPTIGPPDLDFRPAEPLGSSIGTWVQRCPKCSYCAPNLSELIEGTENVIESVPYRKQLLNKDYPKLANSFLCLAMLKENLRDYANAGLSSLYAAWVCDD